MPANQSLGARLTRLLANNQSSIIAFGVFVVVVTIFEFGPLFGARLGAALLDFPMPAAFDSRGARITLLFFIFLYALIAIAAAFKALEERSMRSWVETEAKIVRSQPGFRLIKAAKGMPRNHRIADIGYAYQSRALDGATENFLGSQIRIDEVIPEEEVDALLARYPVGTMVKVLFDPHDPNRSVLERDADAGRTVTGLLALAIIFAVMALAIMWLATHGIAGLKMIPIDRWGWVVVVSALMAAGFFWAETKQRRWLAGLRDWPKVKGVIVSSSVHAFDSGHRNRWNNGRVREYVTSYMPVVEYRYEVSGVSYLSRNIQADMTIAGSEDYAQGYMDRYTPGSEVEVVYDPANPARAAIEATNGFGLTFLIAGSAFTIAAIVTAFTAWK